MEDGGQHRQVNSRQQGGCSDRGEAESEMRMAAAAAAAPHMTPPRRSMAGGESTAAAAAPAAISLSTENGTPLCEWKTPGVTEFPSGPSSVATKTPSKKASEGVRRMRRLRDISGGTGAAGSASDFDAGAQSERKRESGGDSGLRATDFTPRTPVRTTPQKPVGQGERGDRKKKKEEEGHEEGKHGRKAGLLTPGHCGVPKRRLEDFFSPLPGSREAGAKATEVAAAAAAEEEEEDHHFPLLSVSDEAVAVAATEGASCVLEVLINRRMRMGVSFVKSWNIRDLKRRLVWLGHLPKDADGNSLMVRRRPCRGEEELNDMHVLGDLDTECTYEVLPRNILGK